MIELPNGNVILFDEHMDDYRQRSQKLLTSHQLGNFRTSPQLYHKIKTGEVQPKFDSRPLAVGRGAHTLLLEGPEVYEQEYNWAPPRHTTKPFKHYTPTSQKFKDWDMRQHQTGLMPEENDMIHNMVHSVGRHRQASNLLRDGRAEVVVRGSILGVPAQCRIDYLIRQQEISFPDFKSCADIDGFHHDIYKRFYCDQLAFYSLMLGDVECSAYLIACEKQEPYRTGVWRVTQSMLKDRRERVSELILDLKECTETNTWPTGYEEVREC